MSASTPNSSTTAGGISLSIILCLFLLGAIGSTITAAILPQWYTLSIDLSNSSPPQYIDAEQGPFKACQTGPYLHKDNSHSFCFSVSSDCDDSISSDYSTFVSYNDDQCGRLNAARTTLVAGGILAVLAMLPISILLCARTSTSKLVCRLFATTFLFVSSVLYAMPIILIPGIRNGVNNDYVTSQFGTSFILTIVAGGLVGLSTIIFMISNIHQACTTKTKASDQIATPLLAQQTNLVHAQFPMNYQPHQLYVVQPQQSTSEGYLHYNYNHVNHPTQNHIQHQPQPLPYYPQLTYPQHQQQAHPYYDPYSRNIQPIRQ